MMNSRGQCWIVVTACALVGCSDEQAEMVTELTSCDSDRSTYFRLDREREGAWRVADTGHRTYLLFDASGGGDTAILRVSHEGRNLQRISNPSPQPSQLNDLATLRDGGLIVSGATWKGDEGWLARLTSEGQREWAVQLGARRSNILLEPLPDGGALVAGLVYEKVASVYPMPDRIYRPFWARVAGDGTVLWERQPTWEEGPQWLSAGWTLSLNDENRADFVAQTRDGLRLYSIDLAGEALTEHRLDTHLALNLQSVIALPDGSLAIASNRGLSGGAVVTVVTASGEVEWERAYGIDTQTSVTDLVYDAVRDELVLGGGQVGAHPLAGGSTWLLATDRRGEPTWSLVRKALPRADLEHVGDVEAVHGPYLGGLLVADGAIFALGIESELSYFVIGTEACHD